MKTLRLLLFSVLAFTTFSSFNSQQTATLQVEVIGLKNNAGQLMVSLNKGAVGFPDENYFTQEYIPEFTAPKTTVVFKNIPFGNYAFSLLHDEDANGEMKKNFFGIPQEGFAFSRNYNVVLRAPKYEEANFEINKTNQTIVVNMQY